MLSTQTKVQIEDLLDRFTTAWERRDWRTILDLSADDIMGYGPVGGEIAGDKKEFEQKFREGYGKAETLSVRRGDCTLKAEGTIAWVIGDLTLSIDGTILPCRFTMVLRGTGHRWVVVQYHISYTSIHQDSLESHAD